MNVWTTWSPSLWAPWPVSFQTPQQCPSWDECSMGSNTCFCLDLGAWDLQDSIPLFLWCCSGQVLRSLVLSSIVLLILYLCWLRWLLTTPSGAHPIFCLPLCYSGPGLSLVPMYPVQLLPSPHPHPWLHRFSNWLSTDQCWGLPVFLHPNPT